MRTPMKTGNLIASSIALMWGLAIVVSQFLHEQQTPASSTYGTAGMAAVGLAIVLVIAGALGVPRELAKRAV